MRKPVQFFVVDIAAFVLFVLLIATGALLYFILPPGSGERIGIWGLGRHDWGEIHFWIAVGMLSMITLHLILHWRWIVVMIRGRSPQSPVRRSRILFATVSAIALLVMASAPILSSIQTLTEGEVHSVVERHELSGPDLRGSMTLYQVEQRTGMPVALLLAELNLSPNTASNTVMRDLVHKHGFDMERVRSLVEGFGSTAPQGIE